MNKQELTKILKQHKLWLKGDGGDRANLRHTNLRGADLRDADLSSANLSSADLSCADLSGADLRYADLSCANLSSADLRYADLRDADLSSADLRHTNLRYADLRHTNLSGADLSSANLSSADLRYADLRDADLSSANLSSANLSGADLSCANLSSADLRYADLSGVIGLLDPTAWVKENFEISSAGIIVYKAFGTGLYDPPNRWEIAEGSYITEVCNSCRADTCGCGVNFGTMKWIHNNIKNPSSVWKCLIEWIDLVSVVVPYNTDGKARCERLRLVERITDDL